MARVLEKHYNPKALKIAQNFHFGTRNQKPDESISGYVLALKKLAVHCNYGEFLDRALRDRFVCGLSNIKIQNKLLNTESLTFEKVCSIAKPWRWRRGTSTQEFHPTSSESSQVNKLTGQSSKNTEQSLCLRCGGSHPSQSCKSKSAKCYKCSKLGHLASVCRTKDAKRKGNVHNVQSLELSNNADENDDQSGIYTLYSLDTNKPNCNSCTVELEINGKLYKMEIDTAADYSIMSKSEYLERFADRPVTPSKVTLKTYTVERRA